MTFKRCFRAPYLSFCAMLICSHSIQARRHVQHRPRVIANSYTLSISVVVPMVYSTQTPKTFVMRTLPSIAFQSLSPYEVIVVASHVDPSVPLDTAKADIRNSIQRAGIDPMGGVKIVTTHDKNNPGGNRNIGADLATGNLLAFVDSDDFLHVDKLLVSEQAIRNMNLTFVVHDYLTSPRTKDSISWDMVGHRYNDYAPIFHSGASMGTHVYEGTELLYACNDKTDGCRIAHGYPMMRRQAWANVAKYDPALIRGEDPKFLCAAWKQYLNAGHEPTAIAGYLHAMLIEYFMT